MTANRVIVVAVAALVALSCTDDKGEDGAEGEEQVAFDGTQLAARLGCDSTGRDTKKGWDVERPVLCYSDEGWTATIHAPLSAVSRSTALSLLAGRNMTPGRPCPDGTQFDDVWVIAGDTWVVVAGNDVAADRVLERLGGEIQPGDGPGPPISYFALPCP